MEKSAKFQMTIHIDYDREENKIQFLMASQTKMIRTLTIVRNSLHVLISHCLNTISLSK